MMRVIALPLALAVGLASTPLAASRGDHAAPSAAAAAATADAMGAMQSPDVLRAYVTRLPVGSIVKVTPRQGKTIKGILMVVEDDGIVVKPKTRIARPEQRFAFTEIEFVEVQERTNGSNTVKAVGIGVASAVGAFLALLLITVAVIDD